MLCDVCKCSLEGTNDPTVTPRLRVVPPQADSSGRSRLDIEKYVFGHHRTQDSLDQSLEQNCVLCRKFDDLISELADLEPTPGDNHVFVFEGEEYDLASANDGYFTAFRFTAHDKKLSIHIMCNGTEDESTSELLSLEDERDGMGLTFALDDNTYSLEAQKLIKDWDRTCLTEHPKCRLVDDPAFLPTRVLETSNVSSPTACRLVLREEIPLRSRYVALSYCWGAEAARGRLRLLQSTFDTMRTGLPLKSLPKTYVDAIHVAARLGIRYVWIDALCIIQDSQDDWRSEASSMQAVYRNSYLTISAVAGAHDNSGLFYLRDPVKVQPTVVNIAISIYDQPKPFHHIYEIYAAAISWRVGSVTTKRGWCLQERILPSRVLHFGAQQVFWECHELHASEISPKSISNYMRSHIYSTHPPRLWKELIGEISCPVTLDSHESLLSEWYATMSTYTSCKLTHASDKLVAISGLANAMKSALNSSPPAKSYTYLAGLWAEDLRVGLCWVLRGIRERPDVYRAPSWSFASVDGCTSWDLIIMRDKLTWYVNELDCIAVTNYASDIDTGEVTGGRLKLRGPWMIVQTIVGTKGNPLNTQRLASLCCPSLGSALNVPLNIMADTSVFFDTQDDIVEQAFCIPIYANWLYGIQWNFRGIVFAPVEDQSFLYRRVGLVEVSFETGEVPLNLFSQFEKKCITVI